jgi:hypothetical protein
MYAKLFFTGCCAWLFVARMSAGAAGETRVACNSDNVVVIDGREVFPIGITQGPPLNGKTPDGKDALAELRHAGVTFLRTGPGRSGWDDDAIRQQQEWLDAAATHGLYCWINLGKLSCVRAEEVEKAERLRVIVDRFKSHPGLGFWKNLDEAAWADQPVEAMVRGYRIIRERDRDHPVVQTHAPRGTVESLRPYNACADILNLDIYPIGYPPGRHSLEANKEISMVGDWTQFLHRVAGDTKPYWMTLQIAWSGVVKEGKTLRFPTFAQERFMVYQAIINGARGLNFFGGHMPQAMRAEDARLGWNWTFWRRVLRPVLEEIGERSPLAPALVAGECEFPMRVTGTDDVEFCGREAGDAFFLLACKREGDTVRVTFTGLPAWAGAGRVLYEEPREVRAENGAFTDWFAPFDVHVYRFRRP